MSKLFFEILKLSAIVVGTASGLIGTVTQTKNKRSDQLTRWGKIIVVLLVVSGVLSVTIQSVEDYQNIKKDKEDAASRSVEENRTKTILLEAEQLKKGIDSQGKALDTTVSGIDLTARNMDAVFAAQTNALVDMYSLTHPLGNLRVGLNVSYPIAEGVGQLDAAWLKRVQAGTGKNWALINDVNDPLNPKPDTEHREYSLLKQPSFDIEISRRATQPRQGKYIVDHSPDILFRRDVVSRTLLYVHFDEKKVDQQITATMSRVIDTQEVRSWLDLYGAEIIIRLPENAPPGSRITDCNLSFGGASAAEFSKTIFMGMNDRFLRAYPDSYPSAYVMVLSERELGPKPRIMESSQQKIGQTIKAHTP